jgi:beta-ribofuranosylaminobenzene 5'-phosphate synthase
LIEGERMFSGTASTMPDRSNIITVTIPARLHLGFLDLNGGLGRRFGSIGLAITGLHTRIAFRRAEENRASGPEHERVLGHIEKMARRLGVVGGHAADILEVVPAHTGLGSGTQLALAVAAGIRRLHGLPLDIQGDASYLGRGGRSGAGMGLFHCGGLVVDGGSAKNGLPAPIVSHMHFPDRWRVIVMLDPARRGIHGAEEVSAFTQLPPFPDADAGRLCRLVVMKMLPAVVEEDVVSFGSAITEIQACVGGYFAPAQGGSPFTSPNVAAVLAALDGEGAAGIGQSSWGPTGFAFVADADEADRLVRVARAHPCGRGLDIRVCAGFNRGAETTVGSADAGAS